jgi:hypothetical protein
VREAETLGFSGALMPGTETQVQRFLTIDFIENRRLSAPAVWLEPESATPSAEGLNTDLELWRNEEDERNLAVRLTDGFIELKIKSPDDVWIKCLFQACKSLFVDARAAYGLKRGPISSILFRIENPETIDPWRERWPRGHRDKGGQWVETNFVYSLLPTPRAKPVWRESSPLPGSRFAGDLVVWRPGGKPAADLAELGLEDFEFRPIAATNMESICRAIAFATLAYWIQVYLDGLEDWDEILTRTIGGWLARIVVEGRAINARGKSLESVCWSPVDDDRTAKNLLRFLGAKEAAYERAAAELERNPQAPVPGWGSIETLFGPQAKVGIRRAFRAGLDIDAVERLADQYVYDTSAHEYLDRDALLKDTKYNHKIDDLAHQHANDEPPIYDAKGRRLNPFTIYAGSSLRVDAAGREFYPGHEPGALLRYSRVHGLLKGEERHPDEYRLLNTFPGFAIRPIATIDEAIMRAALTMLDRMLGLLTRDNDVQMLWLKKWIAWVIQHPEIKQQSCPVIIGGQGIGKSRFGEGFLAALLGKMAGTADASVLTDNKFVITPFVGRLITFIDEVRLESVSAINIIKKLVRSDVVSGQVKFGHQRDFYIPTRLLIATNSPDIGLTPQDAADRAFFFIMSHTPENKGMTDNEFLDWSLTLKPFYDDFTKTLESVVVRQHLMRHFVEIEVERAELEDLRHSSRNDESVVRATISKPREIARAIVADARVLQGSDIAAWFNSTQLREAIRRVDGSRTRVETSQVLMEFERAGVIEVMQGDLRRFKYRYGTLLKKMGDAHNLPIIPNWGYRPDDDWGNNTSERGDQPQWRGNKPGRQQSYSRRYDDPDAMDPF